MSTYEGDPVPEGLAIQQVSDLLGVPAPTLRSWERRYGIPVTRRSDGGHRRYSASALHELRLMRDEVARGRKASDAARSVWALLDTEGPAQARIQRLLTASRELEPRAVREVLEDARSDLGLGPALDEVLMPSMRQIGSWWESGHCDIAQEHLTTEAARAWLSWLVSIAPPPVHEAPVLLACGPRDLHTLGLEALAALLSHDGLATRLLGARTPRRTLVAAVAATEAPAVVVVSHLSTQRRPAVDALVAVAGTGPQVFYAGNAFLFPDSREGVPGTYLGASLSGAAAVIRERLLST
ncbi:MerR family transcriptional regulator [Nocardioides psychrotolerans]|uniref:B12 binding domain-containing protein n=1 Tax=Nocardioides psychrotolerans TaxID=1005945 RepID=A0A1I3QZX3_9ACTN|nr:MerR family transcriptional regulator [Nocardioides psychrotolerans]SFJ38616.1 B12 binding domain-containing protein [Nocardioides psychrotolerans]